MGLADILDRLLPFRDHSRDDRFEGSTARVEKADRALGEARRVNDLARLRIIREYERAEQAMRSAGRG